MGPFEHLHNLVLLSASHFAQQHNHLDVIVVLVTHHVIHEGRAGIAARRTHPCDVKLADESNKHALTDRHQWRLPHARRQHSSR